MTEESALMDQSNQDARAEEDVEFQKDDYAAEEELEGMQQDMDGAPWDHGAFNPMVHYTPRTFSRPNGRTAQTPQDDSWQGMKRARFFLAGVGAAAVLCMAFVSFGGIDALSGSASKRSTPNVEVHEVVRFDDDSSDAMENGESSDELPSCVETRDTEWRRIVLADFRVPTVLNMSLRLASLKRVNCDPPMVPLEWDPRMFIDDKYPDKEVAILHKFAADCKGESFLMHFRVAGNPDTKFDMEVHHNRGTDLWTLLDTNPSPCWLVAGPGTSGSPRIVNANGAEARQAAEFAIGEINFRARENNCINNQQEITVGGIDTVTVVIKTGLMYTIHCDIKYAGVAYDATLHVIHRCSGTNTQCFYQLELPDGRESSVHSDATITPWCDPLSFRGKNGNFKATGVLDEDRTNSFQSQRVLLYPRKLDDSSREPLQERYIPLGEVPAMHDPRPDDCFTQVAVYNQGQCNAGYASAWAGMMGTRQCLQDKRTRRLQAISETTYNGTARERKLEDQLCADDPNWSVQGRGQQTCKTFAKEGCEGVDYGQFTHCRLSCGSCPGSIGLGGTNPWKDANYHYMPSVEDLASCSMEPNGEPTGCTGGNMWAIWDNFMSKTKRSLWISGNDCKAYTLKCWNEQKIVNPLNEGLCWSYKDYELWHKPCSCIEEKLRPTKLPKCDSEAPPDECSFNVPPAAFVVRGLSSGLSMAEASLNYQRHILESGPLYVAVFMGMNFFSWDWEQSPVYTGDDQVAGGTAMQILGWGGGKLAYIKQPHWILRNSWGADWLEKGSVLWSRGENLHGIENQAGVIMPSPDFADYSAPICRLTSWSRKWKVEETMEGKTLTDYTLSIKVRCSEDCQVRVFFSNQLTPSQARGKGQDLGWEMDGIVRNFDGKKHQDVDAPTIPLHLRGYGLRNEVMWLAIEARDANLNLGETTNVFTIPGIPGVNDIRVKAIPKLSETEPETTMAPAKPAYTTPKPEAIASIDKVERDGKEEKLGKKRKEQEEQRSKQRKERNAKAEKDAKKRAVAREKAKEALEKKQKKEDGLKEDVQKKKAKVEKDVKEEKAEEREENQAEKAAREKQAKKDESELKTTRAEERKEFLEIKAAKEKKAKKVEKETKTTKAEAKEKKEEAKEEAQEAAEAAKKVAEKNQEAIAKSQKSLVSEAQMKKQEKEVKQEELEKRRRRMSAV